jgi:hypothetical protein
MNKTSYCTVWAGIYILCAGLSFIPEPAGFLKFLMMALSLGFFLPPALLLYRGDRNTAQLIRNLSALSLGVTLLVLILNFVLAVSSETLGNLLHIVLTIVSAPMMASGYWVLSLFLWACLLMASLKKLKIKN